MGTAYSFLGSLEEFVISLRHWPFVNRRRHLLSFWRTKCEPFIDRGGVEGKKVFFGRGTNFLLPKFNVTLRKAKGESDLYFFFCFFNSTCGAEISMAMYCTAKDSKIWKYSFLCIHVSRIRSGRKYCWHWIDIFLLRERQIARVNYIFSEKEEMREKIILPTNLVFMPKKGLSFYITSTKETRRD